MTWTLIIILISNSSIKPTSTTVVDFVNRKSCENAMVIVQDIKTDDRITIITRCLEKRV